MQTLTIQIIDDSSLQVIHSLERKHAIKVIEETSFATPSLPGKPMTLKAFKSWIYDAENASVLDIHEAKLRWEGKRKQLQKLTR